MRRLCERPGCSAPAEVSYGIDKVRLLVWVDNRAPAEREMLGRLCRRHADALVVPRGWSLDDRRESVPRLFAAAHLIDTSGGTARPPQTDSSRPLRRPRTGERDSAQSLFDARPSPEEPARSETPPMPEPTEKSSVVSDDLVPDDPAPDDVEESVDFEEFVHVDDHADVDDQVGYADSFDPEDVPREPDDTASWFLRLDGRAARVGDDEDGPTMGRLMGRAFGRPPRDERQG